MAQLITLQGSRCPSSVLDPANPLPGWLRHASANSNLVRVEFSAARGRIDTRPATATRPSLRSG